jgi:hypothetical protein
MGVKSFEDVKNQISYCGIWCGSCVVGNGALRELTRRYEEIVENYGLDGWAPDDLDYKEFSRGLSSIQSMPLCEGCLKGGGNPDCQMRACAVSRGLTDCNDCDQPEACGNRESIERMRTDALSAGLNVKTGKGDGRELIEAWTEELKGKWPSSILFDGER